MKRGRTCKLTSEIAAKIHLATIMGKSLEQAAKEAGIGKATIARWARRGRIERERGEESEFTAFYIALTMSRLIEVEQRPGRKMVARGAEQAGRTMMVEGAKRVADWVDSVAGAE